MILDILTGFDPVILIAFIGAGLLMNLTPGVDFVYVSACGIQGGPGIGMAAAVSGIVKVRSMLHLVCRPWSSRPRYCQRYSPGSKSLAGQWTFQRMPSC